MKIREYKGFLIKKDFVLNHYYILNEHYEMLFFDYYPQSFNRLKDAKNFIDNSLYNNTEYAKLHFNFKKTH